MLANYKGELNNHLLADKASVNVHLTFSSTQLTPSYSPYRITLDKVRKFEP